MSYDAGGMRQHHWADLAPLEGWQLVDLSSYDSSACSSDKLESQYSRVEYGGLPTYFPAVMLQIKVDC